VSVARECRIFKRMDRIFKRWTERMPFFAKKLLDEEKLPTKLLKFLAANYRRSVCAGSESLELRFAP